MSGVRSLSAAAGLVADRLAAEPPDALHPVAWFGSAMQRVESLLWRDARGAGVVYAAIGTGGAWLAGRRIPTATAVTVAAAGPHLRSVARGIGERLDDGDLDGARAALPALVGRDPSELDASGVSAAVIESVAENMVDAVVAPVFWGAVAGAPGALAYRAINTMDAMVGRRNERYGRFGWAAARLDDVANLVPARLFALLVAAAAPSRRQEIRRLVARDAAAHPSPNAGVAETAMAAALGCELGGPLRYGDQREDRPTLGDGPRPDAAQVEEAVRIADRVEWMLTGLLGGVGLIGWIRARAADRTEARSAT